MKIEALDVIDEWTEVKITRYDRSMDSLGIAVEALDMLFENKTDETERFLEAFIEMTRHNKLKSLSITRRR
jgi:hypothetical protein